MGGSSDNFMPYDSEQQIRNRIQGDQSLANTMGGPEIKYNPLNDDGTLKSQFKLGSADSYTAALKNQEQMAGMTARDAAAQQAQTGIAQSKENLAMRGGVGANNSALLEAQGMRQGMANEQAASNQSAQNMSNIGIQGANMQMGLDKSNLGTQLTSVNNANQFNMDKYKQNMGLIAGERQADATEKASAQQGGGK